MNDLWVPSNIENLSPYIPGKPIEETERELGITGVVKLASNENPLGPSKKAVSAMTHVLQNVHLYPDGSSFYLTQGVAKHLQVKPEEVALGAGSNELIELLIRTFMFQGHEALLCQGSFLMYKVALQAHGRAFREVPMRDGYEYDLEAMAAAISDKTRIIFLANPDNPTGTAFSKAELERFLEKVPSHCLVVLDEAYFEFVAWKDYPNGLDYFRTHPNVVVLRTFSKIYGMAGVRLGYGVMQAKMASYLQRTRMPFNVSSVAQVGGLAALDDAEHVKNTREHSRKGVAYFEQALPELGVKVPHSHSNFVFADFGKPAQPIYLALLQKGVITRPVPAYGFPNCLRISVGLEPHNRRLVESLQEILRA